MAGSAPLNPYRRSALKGTFVITAIYVRFQLHGARTLASPVHNFEAVELTETRAGGILVAAVGDSTGRWKPRVGRSKVYSANTSDAKLP